MGCSKGGGKIYNPKTHKGRKARKAVFKGKKKNFYPLWGKRGGENFQKGRGGSGKKKSGCPKKGSSLECNKTKGKATDYYRRTDQGRGGEKGGHSDSEFGEVLLPYEEKG